MPNLLPLEVLTLIVLGVLSYLVGSFQPMAWGLGLFLVSLWVEVYFNED